MKNDYGLIRLYNDYTIAIVIIIFSSYYYYKTQVNNNIDFITKTIKNQIHKEMVYLQNTNDVDYKLSELIVNYYVKSIDNYANNLERKEQNIINDFNNKIIDYDNKYIKLSEQITNSNKLITSLESTYENKIKIIDKEIDEERLRLKAIYEEWKNNVENNINNLNKLSKQYKLEITTLENNKDLITHLQNELKLIKQKSSQLNIELLKINNLISQNKDILIKKLSNDIQKDKTSIESISTISSTNSIGINNQLKEIKKIKTIQFQLNKNKKSLDLIKANVDIIQKKIDTK